VIDTGEVKYDDLDIRICNLVAKGFTYGSIAKALDRSKKTIEGRVLNMCLAVDADNKIEMILKVIAKGIIKNPFDKDIQSPNTGGD
jgi:DNA-binding NarL/FixJ family response regulator